MPSPQRLLLAAASSGDKPFNGKQHGRYRRKHQVSIPVLALLFFLSFGVTLNLHNLVASTHSSGLELLSGVQDLVIYSKLPAQVVLTNFGWNHPNPLVAGHVGRTRFQAELDRGVRHHPWFNPSGLQQFTAQAAPGQRIYVFLDLETCYEENYPNYGWGLTANSDQDNGRPFLSSSGGQIRHMKEVCPMIDRALGSSLFSNNQTVLVLFDCGWNGPPQWSCLNRRHNPKLNRFSVSIVSESGSFKDNERSVWDLGLNHNPHLPDPRPL